MTVMNITTIEADGTYWVSMRMDGCELEPRGPFSTAEAAETTAARFAAVCRSLFHQPVQIGAVRQPVAKIRP